jgi:hypothetical protein
MKHPYSSRFAWLAAGIFFSFAASADEADLIRDLIGSTFDRPDARVISDPIVIERDYALADWTQGDHGGRALLHKVGGRWQIDLCAGDSIRTSDGLIRSGVPAPVASPLAQRLVEAERELPPSLLSQFSSFKPGLENRSHH